MTDSDPDRPRRARRELRPGAVILFAAAHLLLIVGVFLAFGLGLEGPTLGGKILAVLLQPLLLAFEIWEPSPEVQLALVPVNSLLWGLAAELVIAWVRRARAS